MENRNKLFSIFILVLSISTQSYSQAKWLDGLNPSIEFGYNTSYLTYNLSGLQPRVTTEIRIGGLLEKSINKNWAIRSGLRAGIKPKNAAYTIGFPRTGVNYLEFVDETLSKKNHFFLEVPIALVFNWRKFQVGSGMMLRHYIKTGGISNNDFLAGSYETGIHSTFNYHLGNGLSVGLEGYFGISQLFSMFYVGNLHSPQAIFIARSNFVGFSIAYALNGK